MSESEGAGAGKPKAIVVGHGQFSAGLVSAVGQICGLADKLVVLSNVGQTPQDIEATLRDHLARTGARVIFTDLPGGSATIAARRIATENPDIALVDQGEAAAIHGDAVAIPGIWPRRGSANGEPRAAIHAIERE